MDFGPNSAKCRIFARGMQPGFEFGASGSERFVAAPMAGAAIGAGIGGAILQNENCSDCMEAKGWRVVDGRPKAQVAATLAASAAAEAAKRRPLNMRIMPAPMAPVSDADPNARGGLVAMEVFPGGAASATHLRPSGVIVAFEGAGRDDRRHAAEA